MSPDELRNEFARAMGELAAAKARAMVLLGELELDEERLEGLTVDGLLEEIEPFIEDLD